MAAKKKPLREVIFKAPKHERSMRLPIEVLTEPIKAEPEPVSYRNHHERLEVLEKRVAELEKQVRDLVEASRQQKSR